MGIPKFYGDWISTHIPNSITKSNIRCSSLAFDLNGIIHKARAEVFEVPSAQALLNENYAANPVRYNLEFFNKIKDYIYQVVEHFQPEDLLIIAVDGVAPAAKMAQQRSRRERSAKDMVTGAGFDRNAITPGTDIMIQIDKELQIFIEQIKYKLTPVVIYSGHLTPGEGEHKIMEYYRSNRMNLQGNHVIYGLDADLILLSMLSPLNNIYLCREDLEQLVEIEEIKNYLKRYGNSSIHDFTIMMSLVGNDFLPHSPVLDQLSSSIDLMLDTYKKGNYTFAKNNKIDWKNFTDFLTELAKNQNNLLAHYAAKSSSLVHPSSIVAKSVVGNGLHIESFRYYWYERALNRSANNDISTKLDQVFGKIELTEINMSNMILDYCKTIQWIYSYYIGEKIDQTWAYPYYYSPLIEDIAIEYQVNQFKNIGNHLSNIFNEQQFSVVHQMLTVLPKKSSQLIPIQYRHLVTGYSSISDLYFNTFNDEMDGNDVEHLSIPLIPLISGKNSRQRIIDAISVIPVEYSIAKIWEKKEPTIITLNTDELVKLSKEKKKQKYTQREFQRPGGRFQRPDSRRPDNKFQRPDSRRPDNKFQRPDSKFQRPDSRRPDNKFQRPDSKLQRPNKFQRSSDEKGTVQRPSIRPQESRSPQIDTKTEFKPIKLGEGTNITLANPVAPIVSVKSTENETQISGLEGLE